MHTLVGLTLKLILMFIFCLSDVNEFLIVKLYLIIYFPNLQVGVNSHIFCQFHYDVIAERTQNWKIRPSLEFSYIIVTYVPIAV